MLNEIEPVWVVGFVASVLLNALALGALLAVFQPGGGGYFGRHGLALGWAICLGIILGINGLVLLPLPRIVPILAWWVVALAYLKLTVRQTVKLNIALALIFWISLSGLAAAVA